MLDTASVRRYLPVSLRPPNRPNGSDHGTVRRYRLARLTLSGRAAAVPDPRFGHLKRVYD